MLTDKPISGAIPAIDCTSNPDESLKTMFVDIVQQGRIDAGQCPAVRPVFHKTHGVVRALLTVLKEVDPALRQGIFKADQWPTWMRFSSDTSPDATGYKSTIGIGLKLFGVPGPKLIGDPDSVTFDLVFQNHDVFFLNTATDMCAFTKSAVIDRDVQTYLDAHPDTARILDEMAKPEASALSTSYWSILPLAFGNTHAKFKLVPDKSIPDLTEPPIDPNFLGSDLVARLKAGSARFILMVQCRTRADEQPLDAASVRWEESNSPFKPLAELTIPQQDITTETQRQFGDALAFNIWRVTADRKPAGSIARTRRTVYAASASVRRKANNIPDIEPKEF